MQVVDRNGRLKVEITSTVDDLSVGVTTISGGTNGRVLYDNAGLLGEIAGTSSQYIAGDGSLITFPSSLPASKMVTVGRNATGSTLYKGTIVYISGSTGNRPNFVKAQANSEATSAGTFGVIESDIPNNSDGNCVTIGTIDNLDTRSTATNPFTTDTLADGDTIYLSPTTAGYVTNVKPYAPSHLVYVGKVVRTSPTNGTIVYRIQNGYELDELHDVAAQTPSNNDVLSFETSTQLWKPKSIPTLLGYTPVPTTRTLTINGTTQDLSADRTFTISTGITIGTTAITSGTVGRVLFEGTGNVVQESANLFWDNTNGRLGIGTSTPSVAFHVSTSANTTAIFQQSGRPNITFLNGATSIGVVGGAVAVSGGAINDFGIGTNGTTNNLVFATGAGYSERLRINGSTGNVLINTTTDAGFKLDVNGTARVQTSLVINGSSSLFSSALTIYQNASNRIGSLSLSTNKADTTTRTHLSLNSSETSTPQSLDFQYIGATLINDRYNLLQTSEVGVAYGGGLVLQRDGGWVGIGSGTQFASAILAVTSTTRGFLPPRMTTIQKNAIATPATGLMVYDTTLNLISVYNGTTWITL